MDDWLFLLLTLSLAYAIKILITKILARNKQPSLPLPPGPTHIPIITPIQWLTGSFYRIEKILKNLRKTYGPIITLKITSTPAIFIADRDIAHKALLQHGAEFADRPTAGAASRIITSDQHNISSASYGPVWRALRRNLTSEVLNPARIKIFTSSRRWVLEILIEKLRLAARRNDGVVVVMESFQYAMFCLLVLMCFGEKLEDESIKDIETAQRRLLSAFNKMNVFSIFPSITKIVYRKRWNQLLAIRKRQEELFVPLIRKRREKKLKKEYNEGSYVYCYVDSLIDLKLPEKGGRDLTDDEIVSLCSEFLSAGTDTTATALQWVMANLVKQKNIQDKLFAEIEEHVMFSKDKVEEEDLPKFQYLKAIILEGLRRHPPGHFLLPHTVTEDVILNGYLIPKGASVNVMVAEIGWDEKMWDSPMEFRPERFMEGGEGSELDLTGNKGIKMMPFSIGRRICPGMGLALLHLEYFVANLVREFEWITVDGDNVDLTEVLDFTTVMKNPLRSQIVARKKSSN